MLSEFMIRLSETGVQDRVQLRKMPSFVPSGKLHDRGAGNYAGPETSH